MPGAQWRVIHVAKNPETAKKLIERLEAEGILVRVRPLQAEGSANRSCELRVLQSEAEEALQILMEHTL